MCNSTIKGHSRFTVYFRTHRPLLLKKLFLVKRLLLDREAENRRLGHELRLSDLTAGSLDESIYPDWKVARLLSTSLPTSTVKSLNYVFHFGSHDREALPLNASAEKLAMPNVRAWIIITTNVPVIKER